MIHAGWIWIAQSGKRVLSAPVDGDLLRSDSWTLSRRADTNRGPFGEGEVITEAQVVASPETGVVLLPKIKGRDFTALLRAGPDPRKLREPRREDWVPLPGGEKKFAAGFDPESGWFFALTNPVLPAYRDSGWPPEMVRNAAALVISRDLKDWRIATVFRESPNVDYEAFQYLAARGKSHASRVAAAFRLWPGGRLGGIAGGYVPSRTTPPEAKIGATLWARGTSAPWRCSVRGARPSGHCTANAPGHDAELPHARPRDFCHGLLAYDFDGDDLVIASRTAFEVGDGKPPRRHDSNLTTFHRLEDFRRFFAPASDPKDGAARGVCHRHRFSRQILGPQSTIAFPVLFWHAAGCERAWRSRS